MMGLNLMIGKYNNNKLISKLSKQTTTTIMIIHLLTLIKHHPINKNYNQSINYPTTITIKHHHQY